MKTNNTYTLFVSKARVLDIKKNEDGSLLISNADGTPVANAGSLINSLGGIGPFLLRCVDSVKSASEVQRARDIQASEEQEEKNKLKLESEKANQELRESIIKDYKELAKLAVIPSTIENITLILKYLNTQPWGTCELPTMEIDYSCQQYDCSGRIATTMTLDHPIAYDGKMVSMFEVGAPRNHLSKYTKLR